MCHQRLGYIPVPASHEIIVQIACFRLLSNCYVMAPMLSH